jgi:hypothetical protein
MRKWIAQRYKAFVPLVMVGIYLINKHYGWDLPLSQDDIITLLGVLISIGVHQVPNQPMD